jgi:hypothetical protein
MTDRVVSHTHTLVFAPLNQSDSQMNQSSSKFVIWDLETYRRFWTVLINRTLLFR